MDTAQRMYDKIITEATKVAAVEEDLDKVPVWFDKERFERGQKFVQKYIMSFGHSQLCGLLMILQLPNGLIPLLETGNSKNTSKLFRRYLSTGSHIFVWFESNPFEKNSRAYKSLKMVRRMHQNIHKFMNETWKTNVKCNVPERLWVNQHDMVLTVWAFVGPVILHPNHCGLHNYTVEQLEDVIYMWRVLSYANGIKDEYNICTGNLEETRKLFTLIWENSYYKTIVNSDAKSKIGFEMGKATAHTILIKKKTLTWSVIMKFWYKTFNIPINIELTGFMEHLKYYLHLLNIRYLSKMDWIHYIAAQKILKNHKALVENKEKYGKILQKKYPDFEFNKLCPFKFEFDYEEFDDSKTETNNKSVCAG